MKLRLNEFQKEVCMKRKIIALDWHWLTLRSWCQMNQNGLSSSVKHKVEGKTHNILENLKITSKKSTLFGHFLWSIFWSPVFTSVCLFIQRFYPYNSHMSGFVLIMSLLYCCLFDGYDLILGCASEKEKNNSVQLVS